MSRSLLGSILLCTGLLALGLGPGCGTSAGPNDYSAYITAGGPSCGNGACERGDLCVDPTYLTNAGLCRRTPRSAPAP